ncbi:MAG TPA: hypothetical protein VFX49_04835, partial [Chloroflexota bacterium]|nr:hypothetical protein [Chloroflexota bacterium]
MMMRGGGGASGPGGFGSMMRGGSSMYREKPQFRVSPWVTSRRVAQYLAQYKRYLFGALACVICSSGLQML